MHFGLPGTIRDADTDYRAVCRFCDFSCYGAVGLLAMNAFCYCPPVVESAEVRGIQRHRAVMHEALWLENDGAGRRRGGVRLQGNPTTRDRQGEKQYGAATNGAGKFEGCRRIASCAAAGDAGDPLLGKGQQGKGQGDAAQGNLAYAETATMTKTVEMGGFSDDGRAFSYSGRR